MRRTQKSGHFTPYHAPIGQAVCQSFTNKPFHNSQIGGYRHCQNQDKVYDNKASITYSFLITCKVWIIMMANSFHLPIFFWIIKKFSWKPWDIKQPVLLINILGKYKSHLNVGFILCYFKTLMVFAALFH